MKINIINKLEKYFKGTYLHKFIFVGIVIAFFNFFFSNILILSGYFDSYVSITLSYWVGVVFHFGLHNFFLNKKKKPQVKNVSRYMLMLLINNVVLVYLAIFIENFFLVNPTLVFFISPFFSFIVSYILISKYVFK